MLRLADDPDDEPAIGLVLAEINRAHQHRDPGPVAAEEPRATALRHLR